MEVPLRPEEHRYSDYYDMKYECHGVAFIINNRTFDESAHEERRGAERDEYNLRLTFIFLGYRPVRFSNLTSDEINSLFQNIDNYLRYSDVNTNTRVGHDSFICCILSHGNEGVVFGSDSISVSWEEAIKKAGKSEILKDKPKIFFIQACQGKGPGVLISSDGLLSADVYISLATISGNKAYRSNVVGSPFCIEVCKILCEYGMCDLFPYEFQSRLEENMKKYRYESEGKLYVQKPASSSTLKKSIHFFHK